MQPLKRLTKTLALLANQEHYLFSFNDLRGALPDLSPIAYKTLLSRAAKVGLLERICRGLYLYPQAMPIDGLLLFHAAARLRANGFNYISLETALSGAGVISQIPINRITLMSSGRSNVINCGRWGTIEFIHTVQKPTEVMHQLVYDTRCGQWRANISLALRDMRATHRSLDLIDWSVVGS
jgi:hypothetical protein